VDIILLVSLLESSYGLAFANAVRHLLAIAFEIVLLSSDIKAREVWDKLVLKFQLKNHLHVIMESEYCTKSYWTLRINGLS
jgi:hypothetical protein